MFFPLKRVTSFLTLACYVSMMFSHCGLWACFNPGDSFFLECVDASKESQTWRLSISTKDIEQEGLLRICGTSGEASYDTQGDLFQSETFDRFFSLSSFLLKGICLQQKGIDDFPVRGTIDGLPVPLQGMKGLSFLVFPQNTLHIGHISTQGTINISCPFPVVFDDYSQIQAASFHLSTSNIILNEGARILVNDSLSFASHHVYVSKKEFEDIPFSTKDQTYHLEGRTISLGEC